MKHRIKIQAVENDAPIGFLHKLHMYVYGSVVAPPMTLVYKSIINFGSLGVNVCYLTIGQLELSANH